LFRNFSKLMTLCARSRTDRRLQPSIGQPEVAIGLSEKILFARSGFFPSFRNKMYSVKSSSSSPCSGSGPSFSLQLFRRPAVGIQYELLFSFALSCAVPEHRIALHPQMQVAPLFEFDMSSLGTNFSGRTLPRYTTLNNFPISLLKHLSKSPYSWGSCVLKLMQAAASKTENAKLSLQYAETTA
jgi:hypothetical protein